MKRFFLLIAFLNLGLLHLNAQQTRKISGGLRVGMGASDIFYKQFDAKPRLQNYQIAAFVDIPVQDVYAISTGLEWTQKGSFKPVIGSEESIKRSADYLQIPIYFSFLERKMRFDVGVYGGYALNGKEILFENDKPTQNIIDILDGNRDNYVTIRRYDAGMGIRIGYTLSRFDFLLQTQIGLVKLERNLPVYVWAKPLGLVRANEEFYSGRNFSVGFSVGYRIWK
ncbi:MAG: hypothetical protein RL757_122 [Bacteroidota bacterium]|jgi:hypothetical protein